MKQFQARLRAAWEVLTKPCYLVVVCDEYMKGYYSTNVSTESVQRICRATAKGAEKDRVEQIEAEIKSILEPPKPTL